MSLKVINLTHVYSHFLRRADSVGTDSWLVSSNPFDVTGAISSGIRVEWIQRTPEAIFDPWDIQPTIVISSLLQISERIGSEKK